MGIRKGIWRTLIESAHAQARGGRRMSGADAVAVRVAGPGGAAAAAAAALADGGGHFRAALAWAQTGPHRITVLLDGVAVPGTPLAVRAWTARPPVPGRGLREGVQGCACVPCACCAPGARRWQARPRCARWLAGRSLGCRCPAPPLLPWSGCRGPEPARERGPHAHRMR